MAVDKKRKSVDGAAKATATKKVKTAPAPSADKPAPVKSALKGSKGSNKNAEVATTTKTEKKKDNGKKEKTVTKAKKPANKPAAVAAVKEIEEPASASDNEEAEDLTADQTAELLAGFSSSEDEDEADQEEERAIAISEIPNAPVVKHVQKHIRKKTGVNEHDPDTRPGTVHLSRLPHGFFEPQMRAYLEQFGTITHLRLARNRKTGKSKHFAFIEFASSGVADIVAKTMDKYLLFGHIMQARRVPDEQITEDFWKGEGKKRVAPRNKLEGVRLRKGMGREGWEKRVEREEQKRVEKAEKLKELGYEFEMPAVRAVESVPEQKVLKQADEEPKAIESGAPEAAVVTAVTEEPGKVTVSEEKTKKRAASKDGKSKAKKAKKN